MTRQRAFPSAGRALRIAALTAFTAWAAGPSPSAAQGLNLGSADKDVPIEVFADNGIEWQQDNSVLVARGNARAVRAGVNVFADVLRAYYRKDDAGGSQLTRLDGAGNVRIVSAAESIVGAAAVYDLEKAILVVSGDKVTYRSGADVITAKQQMEYYEREQKAVARGDAVAVHDGKTMSADLLEALFRKTPDGSTEVREVRAFDNVTIVTDQDTARARRGIYNVITGIAVLVGDVRITRGQNQLAGDQAEVNVNTGVSKLLTAEASDSRPNQRANGTGSRVRGLIVPQRRDPGPSDRTK